MKNAEAAISSQRRGDKKSKDWERGLKKNYSTGGRAVEKQNSRTRKL